MFNEFARRAQTGQPVFMSEVEAALTLYKEVKAYSLVLRLFDNSLEEFLIYLPPRQALNTTERDFVFSFVLARVYNILSAYGGRSLSIVAPKEDEWRTELFNELPKIFQIDAQRSARTGYGKVINVTDRMLDNINAERGFFIEILDENPILVNSVREINGDQGLVELFKKSINVEERLILGMDIGGTDIKIAVSKGNSILFFKEYDWNPANFKEIDELVDPILILTKLMLVNYKVGLDQTLYNEAQLDGLKSAMAGDCGIKEIKATLELFLEEQLPVFDEIGLCFPDVVIRNRIVGGEVYKTRGIRNNLQERYEEEFKKLSQLHSSLSIFCKTPDKVHMTNDGPMAAFTAGVELACSSEAQIIEDGVFAHTLGTELGSGWIDEKGRIPEIPLEVYNFIIDLGSFTQRDYHPDDLRSVNNFNTHIGGTLQKYTSQSGVFRLAIEYFQKSNLPLYDELVTKGFVVEGVLDGEPALIVPTAKQDLRKPFLEHLMQLTETGLFKECDQVFLDIGRCLAETWLELEIILKPKVKDRFLFGRLVKEPRCFALMQKSYKEIVKEGKLLVADSSIANTSLMRQLEAHPQYTVAQFAQAVGALYFANYEVR